LKENKNSRRSKRHKIRRQNRNRIMERNPLLFSREFFVIFDQNEVQLNTKRRVCYGKKDCRPSELYRGNDKSF